MKMKLKLAVKGDARSMVNKPLTLHLSRGDDSNNPVESSHQGFQRIFK